MGSTGVCWDTAVAETFFATLKKELVQRRSWPEREELRREIFDYIEIFYNATRRHSTGHALTSPLRGGESLAETTKQHQQQLAPSVYRTGGSPQAGKRHQSSRELWCSW